MEEIPTETIKRYLKELGFDDVTPEQIQDLKVEIAKRIKEEEQQNKAANRYVEKSSEHSEGDVITENDRVYESKPIEVTQSAQIETQKPNIKIVERPAKKTNKYVEESQTSDSSSEPSYEPVKQPMIPSLAQKQEQLKTNPYAGLNARPMSSTSRTTRIAQLVGPNRLTLAQKQSKNADPVSRHLKYEQMWAIQGAPQDRRQRLWQQRVAAMQMKARAQYKVGDYYD